MIHYSFCKKTFQTFSPLFLGKVSIQIGEEKGREEGEKQAKIAVAKEMLADKMYINTIAKFTGLPVSEIEKLQK